jgi:GH18 family chitinase
LGQSSDYPNVPEWTYKPEGYQTGAMVKYRGNVFLAAFWASEPGTGDPAHNGWRLYDELYDLTPHTPTAQAKIVGYIPTWYGDLGTGSAAFYQNITHALVSFLMFSGTTPGALDPQAAQAVGSLLATVVPTGHAAGVKAGITIGGATDYAFLALMGRAGANSQDPAVTQAVANVAQFVNAYGIDHVELDLECWWSPTGDPSKDQGGRLTSAGPHPAGLGLTAFASQLRQALPGISLSATLPATSWYGNNFDGKVADQVDWLSIETYDFTGSWNASPVGPHTELIKIRKEETYAAEQQGAWPGGGAADNPILAVEDSLWYWTNPFYTNWQGAGQKLPRNKTMLGVPLYGYDFAYAKGPDPESGQIPPGYKVLRYKDILSQFPGAATAAAANIKVAGSTPRPAFTGAAGDYPYAHNVYFETPDTAVTKLNFTKALGIAGVIVWELSSDAPTAAGGSVLSALYRNSGNPKTRPPISTGFSSYVFTSKDGTGNQISVSIHDTSVSVNGTDYPARVLTLPQYNGIAQYYVDGNAAVLYRLSIGSQLGLGLSLANVMLNVLARDAHARNLSVVRLWNQKVLAG